MSDRDYHISACQTITSVNLMEARAENAKLQARIDDLETWIRETAELLECDCDADCKSYLLNDCPIKELRP